VVTVHGAANLSLPLKYTFPSFLEQIKGWFINAKRKLVWSIYKYKVAHVITVSKYAKEEIINYLNLEPALVSIIYHGYDDRLFFRQSGAKPYLLHVSSYQPKKNVDRIVEAYQAISHPDKLPLIIICPGYSKKIADPKITLYTTSISSKEVAKYFKEAYGFIFPSIHESFGMPMLEAMACGVPVITSNITACPEIVQDAGLCVDPYSVKSLQKAMEQLMADKLLHDDLSGKALERAAHFSWEKTARLHEVIFQRFVN
jgi:glycosyltransferase involved in cell wall biosynthesis